MRKSFFFSLLLTIFLVLSCKDAPGGLLSRQEMEDVLFDYHLTQGILEQLTDEEKMENTQRYVDAVFAKHGVTEEQFDSSMVWYFREGKQLSDIYKNVHSRLEAMDKELKLRNGSGSYAAMSSEGDTANIWPGQRTLILRNTPLLCCDRFSIEADSTFRRGDKFLFVMANKFTKGMSDERENYLNVALTLQYTDGTATGNNRTVDIDGTFQFEITADKEKELKSMHGYFFFKSGGTGRRMCTIRDIALVRMHDMTLQQPAEADTLSSDSLAVDTLAVDAPDRSHHERLTPEQLHEQVAPSHSVKILTAPEVRTKNSYGVRRSRNTK